MRGAASGPIKEGGHYSRSLASAPLSHILFSVYIRTCVCTSQTLFLCGPNFTRRRQQVRQTLSDSRPNGLRGEGVQSFRGEAPVRQLFGGGRANGKISASTSCSEELRPTVWLLFL